MLTAESGNQFSFSVGVIFSIFCYTFFFSSNHSFFFFFLQYHAHISFYVLHLLLQDQIKCIALFRTCLFSHKRSLSFVFFPLSTLNCLQSYGEVPSTATDPQKTLNSSFLFALEHLNVSELSIWLVVHTTKSFFLWQRLFFWSGI